MNPTGTKLLKWVKERKWDKDEWISREYCREMWDMYGEIPIKKALNHSACTSLGQFRKLASTYKKKTKPKKLFTDNPYYN